MLGMTMSLSIDRDMCQARSTLTLGWGPRAQAVDILSPILEETYKLSLHSTKCEQGCQVGGEVSPSGERAKPRTWAACSWSTVEPAGFLAQAAAFTGSLSWAEAQSSLGELAAGVTR